MVMQEVANVYFASRLGVSRLGKISVAFAESKFRKLIEGFGRYMKAANLPSQNSTQVILCQ